MQKNYKKLFKNKKIIVTGHTGFKGTWLSAWLVKLGAKVTGVSNGLPSSPSHYKYLNFGKKIKSYNIDIRNYKKIHSVVKKSNPDFIFHLAAQALVKKSYNLPGETFYSNSIGTLNLLESLRNINKRCIVIIITSDKVYKNLESKTGYKETDLLGGEDPYSASKAAAEIIIHSYIKSFFSNKKNKVLISVARAGNVIGGGDWAVDRLIPDCVRAWSKNKLAIIRNPKSTRPWQHVLEAVWGYIALATFLNSNKKIHGESFNFGPPSNSNHTVKKIVQIIRETWKNAKWTTKPQRKKVSETNILKLNSSKSYKVLNWKCSLTIKETMTMVSEWYQNFYLKNGKINNFTLKQINYYESILRKRNFKK